MEESHLLNLLSNDNQIRSDSEKYFQTIKAEKPKEVILSLFGYVHRGLNPSLSLLCLVLLRNLVIHEKHHFQSLTNDDFGSISDILFGHFVHSHSEYMALRSSHFFEKVTELICSMQSLTPWNHMYDMIASLSNGQDLLVQQSMTFLLSRLIECGHISPNHPIVGSILARQINSNCIENRFYAVHLHFVMLYAFPNIIEQTSSIMVPSFEIIDSLLYNNESLALRLLEDLSKLIESNVFFLKVYRELFLSLYMKINSPVSQNEFEDRVKILSLESLTSLSVASNSNILHESSTKSTVLTIILHQFSECDDVSDHYWLERPNDEGEFFDENSGIHDITVIAAQCLSLLVHSFSISGDIVPICCQFIESSISCAEWKSRRGGLYLLDVLCEIIPREIYPFVCKAIPVLCHLLKDQNIPVVYSSFACISAIIEQYSKISEVKSSNEEDEAENDDNGNENTENRHDGSTLPGKNDRIQSIQDGFHDMIPAAVLSALKTPTIQSNMKLLYYAMHTMRLFFDPDMCKKAYGKSFYAELVQFCEQLLSFEDSLLLFVHQEALDLLANSSLFCPSKYIKSHYPAIISHLQRLLSVENNTYLTQYAMRVTNKHGITMDYGSLSMDLMKLKGSSLQCFAVVGKAVGPKMFFADAIQLMDILISYQNQGLDYSNPFSSLVLQTCVRIATVIGNEFEPYLNSVIPHVLAYVGQPFSFLQSMIQNSSDQEEALAFAVNSHEMTEREMALRVVYQYLLDIPKIIAPFVPNIIESVFLLFQFPILSDNIYLIGCAIFSDALKLFFKYCDQNDSSLISGNEMVSACLSSMRHPLALSRQDQDLKREMQELCDGNECSEVLLENNKILVDGIRELLRVIHSEITGVRCWSLTISPQLLSMLQMDLALELICWCRRNLKKHLYEMREEAIEEEDDFGNFIVDSIAWIAKIASIQQQQMQNSSIFFSILTGIEHYLQAIEKNQSLDDCRINSDRLGKVRQVILNAWLENVEHISSELTVPTVVATLELIVAYFKATDECIAMGIYGIGLLSPHLSSLPLEAYHICLQIVMFGSGLMTLSSPSFSFWDVDNIDDDTSKEIQMQSIYSLIKIALHKPSMDNQIIPGQHGLSEFSFQFPQVLDSCMARLPLNIEDSEINVFDCQEFHFKIVREILDFHSPIYGQNFHRFPTLLGFLMKLLVSVDFNVLEEDEDIWEEQILTKKTWHIVKDFLVQGIQGDSALPVNLWAESVVKLPKDLLKIYNDLKKSLRLK